ncbi:hypothetical protein AE23_01842 [Klebsiella pneumoniae UCI 64]|nr:hypothetical protein AE23_01842 [Klebsiella pneumoniae UCI 64]
MTLQDSISAISSPGSADGRLPCVAQDGPTVARHGQRHAPASLSARQVRDLGLLTSGTYGPPHIGLPASAALSWSLASNLAALTQTTGSTLYKMTWKPWVMPSARLRFRLRASARRTSETELIGWPTPIASNGRGAGNFNRQGGGKPSDSCVIGWLVNTERDRWRARRDGDHLGDDGQQPYANGENGGMADTDGNGWQGRLSGRQSTGREVVNGQAGRGGTVSGPGPVNGFWRDADWLYCRDGKWRPVRSGSCPLADGIPARVGRLRTYGNAINIEAATAFIKSYMAAVDYA